MTYMINYALNKKLDLNIHVFNTITGKNESKILANDLSCECKCNFDGEKLIQTKSGTSINVDAIVKKIYVKNSI